MIGYGINVGRAGTAGAAAGAGAAGIFSGLKGSLDTEEQKSGPTQARQASVDSRLEKEQEKPADKKDTLAEEAQPEAAQTVSWDSGTATTSNGFVISGLARRPTRASYGPSSTGPVVKVSRPAAASQNSDGQIDSDAAVSSAADSPSAPSTPANVGVFEPIVTRFGSSDRSAGSAPATLETPPGQPNGVATISIEKGTSIEALIAQFGEPLLALTGISGEEYTEKYVFKTADGTRFTVFSFEGKVTAVLAGPGAPAARAAL